MDAFGASTNADGASGGNYGTGGGQDTGAGGNDVSSGGIVPYSFVNAETGQPVLPEGLDIFMTVGVP